jgi:hypothetical protein
MLASRASARLDASLGSSKNASLRMTTHRARNRYKAEFRNEAR